MADQKNDPKQAEQPAKVSDAKAPDAKADLNIPASDGPSDFQERLRKELPKVKPEPLNDNWDKSRAGVNPIDPESDKPQARMANAVGVQQPGPDPRGDGSPRREHITRQADHPNQPVVPTRYAQDLTTWLGLPEAARKQIDPPAPPEGHQPHPLAAKPVEGEKRSP
jgi:hypothetical protein